MKQDSEKDGNLTVAKAVSKIVLKAQKASIKLPFIRKVVKDGLKMTIDGKEEKLSSGQTIVCDIVSHPQYHPRDSWKNAPKGF